MTRSPKLEQDSTTAPSHAGQKRAEERTRPRGARQKKGNDAIKSRATTNGSIRSKKTRSSRNDFSPAPNSLPLWGELSILDAKSMARLRSAATRLRRSEVGWLVAAGTYVGRTIDYVSGTRQRISSSELALPKNSSVNVWDALATHASADPVTALEDGLAIVQVCSLYWLLVPENLIRMHEFMDQWPGRERVMLSRSLRRLGSVSEMYRYLAEFKIGGELPPFGATAGVLLTGARQSEVVASIDRKGRSQLRSIIAGGDVLLAPDLASRVADRGTESVLSDLQGIISAADVAIVNLETVIANGGRFVSKQERSPTYLHCPPMMVNVLVEGGITCVTAANDHAFDFGEKALAEQTALLTRLGIAQVGANTDRQAAERPAYLDADGMVVAVLAFEAGAPPSASSARARGVFHLPIDEEAVDTLRPLIAEARRKADIVVVSPHWGANRRESPSGATRRLAREIIDLGADAVLGHSAQVLQGIEMYQEKPIIYDMGCLVADRLRSPETSMSALFELRVDVTGVRQLVIRPVTLSPGKSRLASGEAARTIFDRIVGMSVPLNDAMRWRHKDDTLILEMSPQRKRARKRQEAPQLFGRDRVRLFTEEVSDTTPTMIRKNLPSKLSETEGVDMGGGFVVLGQRRPRRVATACGFLVEILFRCPDPARRSWRAALLAEPEGPDGTKFRYRHSVSEGMWASQVWESESVITDSFVVRPPKDVRPGFYRLRWSLIDAESGRIWPAGPRRSPVGWVELGRLEITDDAPAGVAGLDWGSRLSWTPLTPSDRSR